MKKSGFIVNVVLIVAIATLYFLYFKSDKKGNNTQLPPAQLIVNQNNDTVPVSIVFVNVDTLLEKYQYSIDLNEQFKQKKSGMKKEFDSKSAAFEKEARAFQEKLSNNGFLSQQSAESQQSELLEKQQSLEQLHTEMQNQLLDEQDKLNRQLFDTVTIFLKDFNKDYHYQFILSNAFGGNLLYADEHLDITENVLVLLNQRYEKSKSLKKNKK